MYFVRPVDFADLPALERLAKQAGIGFTNFPANRDSLNDKISCSRQSMQAVVTQPGEEAYYFVLVNKQTDKVVGVCGIEAMVGTKTPFYSYRIDEVVHASPQLQIHNRIPALFLCHDYNGTSRLVAMIVDKAHQTPEAMALLSRARLLFIAKHAERFTNKLFVELRGESDAAGFSPFWNALGKHFFSMDFEKADYLSGVTNKHFIADLMPRYPIYIPTLPDIAQQVIGVVHETSENVSDILLREGFCFRDYVDVFDAGPTIEARQQDINTIVNSRLSAYQLTDDAMKNEQRYLIACGELEDFRVTLAPACFQQNSTQNTVNGANNDMVLQIPHSAATVLGLALQKSETEIEQHPALKKPERVQWIALHSQSMNA
ncbi:arginine N-succinyltransferase [Marinomonas agarivorans]|nr:arginine N-succinyltransferase [Marinomonas agarivorans]